VTELTKKEEILNRICSIESEIRELNERIAKAHYFYDKFSARRQQLHEEKVKLQIQAEKESSEEQ
jgi:hypothetical protein